MYKATDLVVERFVPSRAVEQFALKVMKTFDGGPSPLIQGTDSRYQRIRAVFEDLPRFNMLKPDSPLRCFLVPSRFNCLVPKLHVLPAAILVCQFLPVLKNLRGFGVE